MGKYFVNIFTEYKSPETSNKYVRDTLLMSNESHLDFVIVDNSLDENNFEMLSTYYEDRYQTIDYQGKQIRLVKTSFDGLLTTILYVKNDKNTGYGSGGNLGVKVACDILKPDYIIISNNDMICTDDCIDLKIVDKVFTENEDVGIVGVNIQNLDGSFQSPCRKVSFGDRWILPELFYPLSRKFKKRSSRDLITNAPSGKVYRVRGSFMIILPKAFLACGGFDEKIFMYSEEPILAERMKKIGYLVYHLNDIHMLHNHIMDGRTLTNSEIKKIKQRFQSEMYYYETYLGVSKFKIGMAKFLFPFYWWRFKVYEKIKQKKRHVLPHST